MKIIRPHTIGDSGSSVSVSALGTRFNSSGNIVAATGNVMRLDYDPADLYKAPRVLLERTSIQYALQTEVTAGWINADTPVLASSYAFGKDWIKIGYDSGSGDSPHVSGANIPSTGYYTYSLYIDLSSYIDYTGTTIRLSAFVYSTVSGFTSHSCDIVIATGAIAFAVTIDTASITVSNYVSCSGENIKNDIWRYNIIINVVEPAGQPRIYLDVTEGSLLTVGLPQIESGNGVTSYIPNASSSASVTRTYDNTSYYMHSNIAEPDTTIVAEASISLWSSFGNNAVYDTGDKVIGSDHFIYESELGATLSPVTISIASPCVVTYNNHGLANGTRVAFQTTGTLPTGLVANGQSGGAYYVVNTATNTFNVSATLGGAAINTSGTQSGTQSVVWGVVGDPVTGTANWLKTNKSNRWAAFDGVVNTNQANQEDVIAYYIWAAIGTTMFTTDVCLFNVDCAGYRVVAYSGVETGEWESVFDSFGSGSDNSGVSNWWEWFTEPIERIENINISGLPPYEDLIVCVTLANTGETVYCGECIVGLQKDVGALQANARIGIQDYSVKEVDTFGRYTILERTFSAKIDYTVWVDSTKTDSVLRLLKSYRATPIVYIGEETKRCTYLYGFYKDHNMVLSYPTVDILNIELEGLS